MKRRSVLQDYKPRLEWIDPAENKRNRRKKKIYLAVCTTLVSAWIYFTLNLDLSSVSNANIVSKSTFSSSHQNENVISQELSLSPNPLIPVVENKRSVAIVKERSKIKPVEKSIVAAQPVKTKKTLALPFEPSPTLKSNPPKASRVADRDSERNDDHINLDQEIWRTVTVKEGDNLSLIFSRLAINKSDLYQILSLGDETDSLKRLMPGQVLRLKFDNDANISELIHESDLTRTLQVTRSDESFQAEITEETPKTQIVSKAGTIKDSLFLSGQKAGLSDNIIMQLFEIFGWDIDFVLDIREDDTFRVVYEELYKNDQYIKDGVILAAEFINKGKSFKAVRFVDSENRAAYYSETGNSMRKAFLRTPVNFTRISSHFNLKRKHPVLNKIRAHKGVDYAAPSGTPVKAIGDGKVIFSGSKNGYGKTVVIEHGGKYTTLYAHLSRFARGLKKGKRVEQGQTIAYVGQSGLATGPHLHYEFRVDGQHRNPLTVTLPKSMPLPRDDLKVFKKQTRSILAKLESLASSSHHATNSSVKDTSDVKRLATNSQLEEKNSSLN